MSEIAQCSCGETASVRNIWVGHGPYPHQVHCGFCGRRGPIMLERDEAIKTWNADGDLDAERAKTQQLRTALEAIRAIASDREDQLIRSLNASPSEIAAAGEHGAYERLRHAVAVATGTLPGKIIPSDDVLIDRLRDQRAVIQRYRIQELEAQVADLKKGIRSGASLRPALGAVNRIVFLHGKESPDSVIYRQACEELEKIGVTPE